MIIIQRSAGRCSAPSHKRDAAQNIARPKQADRWRRPAPGPYSNKSYRSLASTLPLAWDFHPAQAHPPRYIRAIAHKCRGAAKRERPTEP